MQTLFYNAHFHTMSNNHATYNAVLCNNRHITATFHQAPENLDCPHIDLHNTHVYPGFIDAHTHCFEGGLYQHGADLSTCTSIADILDQLSETTPFSDLVLAFRFDENNIKEHRFPHRSEIDKIYPDTPVLLRRVDGHSCVVNTAAQKIIRHTLPPDGLLRKELNDLAAHTFHKNLSDVSILKCYHQAQTLALKNGLTGIHTMIGDAQQDPLHFSLFLQHQKDFIINFTPYPQCFNITEVCKITCQHNQKPARIGGCILADGSFGSHTAALSESYIDIPDCYGTLYQTQQTWDDFISEAHAQGMQVGVHCIGDAAILQIIHAIQKANQTHTKNLRHQIIHSEYVTDEMIPLIKANNIFLVMQPMFDALWGGEEGFYASVIGKDRVKHLNRFKSLTEAGITICGSSDWYVTDLSPIAGINAAVNHHNPSERLSRFESVKLYTTNPHLLANEQDTKGLIEKGYQADFACLNADLLTTDNIATAEVVFTIKNGEIVYEKITHNV